MLAEWQLSAFRGADMTLHCPSAAAFSSYVGRRLAQTGLLSRKERYRRLYLTNSSNRGYEASRYDINRRSQLSLAAGLLTAPFLPKPVFGEDAVTGM